MKWLFSPSLRTWTTKEKKGVLVLKPIPHKSACVAVPERKCADASCGYTKGHTEEKDKEKEEKKQKKEAQQKKRDEENLKKKETAEQKKKSSEEESRKTNSRIRNGDLRKFIEAAGTKDNTPAVLNQAVALANLWSKLNKNSLYLPGATRDDDLAMMLSFELERGGTPPFSTHGE